MNIYKNFLLLALAFTCLANAQNELYINGDNTLSGANPEVYVNDVDGTNPTLFVAGDITNNNGQLINAESEIELTGDFTNTANGSTALYQSTGIERFSGDENSTVYGAMDGVDTVNNFYDLKLEKDAASDYLNLSVNTNVKNTLEFESNGIIRTDIVSHGDDGAAYPNELFILNQAGTGTTIINAASAANIGFNYIEGKLRHQINGANTYYFPIGITPGAVDAGTQPISLTFSAADSSDILAYFEPATQGLNNGGRVYYDVGEDPDAAAINDLNDCIGTADGINDQLNLDIDQDYQWQVNKGTTGSTFNYSITTMPSPSADISATNAGTYGCENIILRYLAKNGDVGGDGVAVANSLPDFNDVGYHVAPTGYTISAQTSFSTFRLHSVQPSSVTLPVELISLEANEKDDKYIQINWTTATELNNDGFDLQRSEDGLTFKTISWIEGNGNSDEVINYSYNDLQVAHNQTYYYRLNQIDYDGANEYSHIVSSRIKNKELFSIIVYPNPSKENDKLNIEINSPDQNDALIYIYDIQGKIINQSQVHLTEGINTFELDKSQFASGNYFVKIATKSDIQSKQISVLK